MPSAFIDALSLYSLRKNDLVQATLQVSRFNDGADVDADKFRQTVVNQIGGTAPRTVRLGSETVYLTTGTKQTIACGSRAATCSCWPPGQTSTSPVRCSARRWRSSREPPPPDPHSGLLVVTALGLSGCKGDTDAEKRLREALRNTEKLSNTFLYKETVHDKAGNHEIDVRGLVEDDFRYKARVAADGKPLLDEVVSDDAIAVRFLEPAAMGRFLRKPAEAKQSGSGVGGGSATPERPPSPPVGPALPANRRRRTS